MQLKYSSKAVGLRRIHLAWNRCKKHVTLYGRKDMNVSCMKATIGITQSQMCLRSDQNYWNACDSIQRPEYWVKSPQVPWRRRESSEQRLTNHWKHSAQETTEAIRCSDDTKSCREERRWNTWTHSVSDICMQVFLGSKCNVILLIEPHQILNEHLPEDRNDDFYSK